VRILLAGARCARGTGRPHAALLALLAQEAEGASKQAGGQAWAGAPLGMASIISGNSESSIPYSWRSR
jgi:hypothetical protein